VEVSPCPADRDVTATQYAAAVARAAALIDGLDNGALAAAVDQVTALAGQRYFESAARLRDRTATTVEALWRGQRLRGLAALPELIAAAPDGGGGYHLAVIRYGQLAAAGAAKRGVPPMPVVDAIHAGAQAILRAAAPLGGALVEETALIARWLAGPGVRIVRVADPDSQGWASPLGSAGAWAAWAAAARSARLAAEQAVGDWDSHLLAEPHPSREQLFGRTGVDGRGGALQPVLPRRQPFGAAG
jgi:DNA polymerase III subunit epsilon